MLGSWKIWLIVLLLLALAAFMLKKRLQQKEVEQEIVQNESEALPVNPPPVKKPKGNDNFPLRVGSYGQNVKYLQQALNLINGKKFPALKVDGDFNEATRHRLLRSVETRLSALPLDQDRFTEILKMGRRAAGG